MPIKPVLTTLIALLSIILALYTIQLPSSRSLYSIATNIINNSQLGALVIHSTFFRYKHHHHHHRHHHHHHHEPIKCCEKWTSRLTHVYKTSLVLTVDLHGCGNFSNVQSAIDAVPDLSPSKTLIIVNSGSYRSYLQLQALVLFPLSPMLLDNIYVFLCNMIYIFSNV